MKSVLRITACGLVASVACMLGASSAMANDQTRVNWSINVGTPYYPAAVYSAPQTVYVQQPTVYVQREPVAQYRSYYPQAYYVEEVRHPHWRWKRHHKHHDD